MPPTFRDRIAANKRNSVLLVAGFVLFVTVVTLVLSQGVVAYYAPELVERGDWAWSALVGLAAAGVALMVALASYYGGDQLVLGVSGARPIAHRDDPELYNVVEEMALAAGVPVPKVYEINDTAPNAFATGRDPAHASVAVTRGLRQKLTRDELQGVIAHEMSHVRNYDIRLMLLMAVLVGTVVMLSDFFLRVMFRSRRRARRGGDRDNKGAGGAVALVLIVVAVLLALVAPLLAQLIQLAVSREREYLADASAVELTRYPPGLANALRKIDTDPEVLEAANRGTAHLYIANPIKKFEARASSLFSSHPPIKERIRRLEEMA